MCHLYAINNMKGITIGDETKLSHECVYHEFNAKNRMYVCLQLLYVKIYLYALKSIVEIL